MVVSIYVFIYLFILLFYWTKQKLLNSQIILTVLNVGVPHLMVWLDKSTAGVFIAKNTNRTTIIFPFMGFAGTVGEEIILQNLPIDH